MDRIVAALRDIAGATIGEYFFDPDREDTYKSLLAANRPTGDETVPLTQFTQTVRDGDVVIDIAALRTWTFLRVAVAGAGIAARIEGAWNFGAEELRQVQVFIDAGKPARVARVLEDVADSFDAGDLEDFDSILDELTEEPVSAVPPADLSAPKRRKLGIIMAAAARNPDKALGHKDELWLLEHPAAAGILIDRYVGTASVTPEAADLPALLKVLRTAAHTLSILSETDARWADDLIDGVQSRIDALATEGTLRDDVLDALVTTLKSAGIPLAQASQDDDFSDDGAEDVPAALGTLFDELASLGANPFQIVESLEESPATISDDLRSHVVTEFGLSPHAALREVLPLVLLDPDRAIRRHAALTLEQIAFPDRLSPVMLRRMIGVRNWIPVTDRSALDAAIRKARLAGVESAHTLPAPVHLTCWMSLPDGAGTVSVFLFDKTSRRGFLVGLALRLGEGVIDMWVEPDTPRRDVERTMKQSSRALPLQAVSLAHASRVIEHALASGLATGDTPPVALLQAAEITGSVWQDRLIDIAAEIDVQVAALPEAERTGQGRIAALERAVAMMEAEPLFQSWFEDNPELLADVRSRPRRQGLAFVLLDYLSTQRMDWAERFLFTGLLYRESAEPSRQAAAAPFLLTAQALTGMGALDDIPAMVSIAQQTMRAARQG